MKDPVTRSVANLQLDSIIQFASQNKGTVVRIKRELDRLTGKCWRRENIERWITKSEKRRTMPGLGVGLLLIEIGNKLMKKQ